MPAREPRAVPHVPLGAHRRSLGLNQTAVASALGVYGVRADQERVSRWETGAEPIPPAALPHLAQVLHLDDPSVIVICWEVDA